MRHITHNEAETALLAQNFAKTLEAPAIILLEGNLGMGKSVFARSLIRTLCNDKDMDVPSPTFTLVQIYEAPETLIRHFDLYRLKTPDEIYELGWEEVLEEGITIVEWPERLDGMTPKNAIKIYISADENATDTRIIEITP